MADSRNIQIDCLKGLAIILMILGHMPIPHLAKNFIFSFHMPLFFFISGYLYKEKPLKEVIKSNARKVLFPYIFTCFIVWVVMCVEGNYIWGISILLANGSYPVWHFSDFFVGPLWFLACYFVSSIGFAFLRKCSTDISLCLLLTLWIGAIIYKKHFNLLPFDILNAIPAIVCMEFGYLLNNERIQGYLKHHFLFLAGVLIWFFCFMIGDMSMASFSYKFWFVQLIGALFGTLSFWYLLTKIRIVFFGGGYFVEFYCFYGAYKFSNSMCPFFGLPFTYNKLNCRLFI